MGIWEITRKDLALQFRERRAFALLLVFPLSFIATLGLTLGKVFNEGDNVHKYRIAVVDEDGGRMAARVVGQLRQRESFVVEAQEAAAARDAVDSGTSSAALFFGPEFGEKVDSLDLSDILDRKSGRLQRGIADLDMHVETRPAEATTAEQIELFVFADVLGAVTPIVACRNNKVRNLVLRDRCDALEAELSGEATPAGAVDGPGANDGGGAPANDDGAAQKADGNEPLVPHPDPVSAAASEAEPKAKPTRSDDIFQQLVPGFTVMFVFFLVNLMARSFIQERDLGTLRRLRMAPVRPVSILLGKTVPFLLLSLLQTGILFACGRWMFGMTWGPLPWLLLPVALCTSLAATSLGLLIATLVRTDSQVSAYANIVVILSAGISGCFIPRQWLTPVMKPVSLAVPHGWALVAYDTLLKSARPDVMLVWECCAAILGFALLYFLLGTRFFAKLD